MRPYQIVATERILQRIETSTNYKQLGTVDAGGYVWHTTGSGKTLTSFKTAQLATRLAERRQGAVRGRPQGPRLPDHARVRPVREGRGELQHLDREAEEAAGGPGRADHHHHDPEARSTFIGGEQGPRDLRRPRRDHLRRVPPLPVRRHAHRDHQGVQAVPPVRLHRHADLRRPTPAPAATRGCGPPSRRSGSKLHTYTIVDAINDKNVLPFRIDYVNTIKLPAALDGQAGLGDRHRAGAAGSRAGPAGRSSTSVEHFDQKTRRNQTYRLEDRRVAGFNALFATASIEAARRYYNEFALAAGVTCPRRSASRSG